MKRIVFVCVSAAAVAAACATPPRPPSAAPAATTVQNARATKEPPLAASEIDAALRAAWRTRGITPAPPVDDARFLRRVWLDVVGTVPSPADVRAFLADSNPDKRRAMVNKLLASPRYAEHWATYWDAELLGREARAADLDRASFHRWLAARFAANERWDKIVFSLVTATGQNSNGGPRTKGPVTFGAGAGATEDTHAPIDVGINPAVNWTIRHAPAPQDLAGSAARTFLGVQIQCAQCHDHKSEAWTQKDFRMFASCFARTQIVPLDPGKTMGQIRRVELRDVSRPVPRFTKNPELAPIAALPPRALDGTDLSKSANARFALGAWMVSKDNPYFAKAMVNRIWAHFLGRGFVDPVDDLRPSNPPVEPALFDRLAADFRDAEFDLHHLIRLVTATEAYQLSAAPAKNADSDNRSWARFRLVPLGPEELLNALFAATNVEEAARLAGRSGNLDQLRAQLFRQYGFLFDVDEDTDQRDFEGSVAQALALVNGTLVEIGSSAIPGTSLADILTVEKEDRARIAAIYVRALGRPPTEEELSEWSAFVAAAHDASITSSGAKVRGRGDALRALGTRRGGPVDVKRSAYEDIFWSLLNSSEFLFNH